MLKRLLLATCALVFSAQLLAADNPRVLLTTSMGEIELELDAGKAPISVENFLAYVEDGHYDGTQFHRVIPDFMIQGVVLTRTCSKSAPARRSATKPTMA